MSEVAEVSTTTPAELLAAGRRHLAVKDFSAAVETLAQACEALAQDHGDTADQCADAYLWYGKALLGLSREESGVLGGALPGSGNADDDEDNEENGEEDQNGDAQNGEVETEQHNGEAEEAVKQNGEVEKIEAESTTNDDEPGSSSTKPEEEEPSTSNGDGNEDESMVNLENEDDVDNLQLAWEMLELSRSIFQRRAESGGGEVARAQLADVHLALGEVALESETYDKAVVDMQSCLEIQKELYPANDRRIAETHYQIGLANSLSSNFEDAITHFKNAANILETRIKTLENPATATEDATVKKFATTDPFYSIEGEIKELKELLPEIQEKIQDMMDYKAETIRRVRETLMPSNGQSSHGAGISGFSSSSASSSSSAPKPAASDISHLIKRKRKSSENEAATVAKKPNTGEKS